ncbi:hypothetical protein MTO96_017444 [Rhipicephalus appendiculatus]
MARPRYLVVVVVLAAACAFLAAADEEQHADGVGSTEAPSASAETSTVEDIEPLVAEAVSQAFKMGLPVFTQFGSDPNVSSECSAALVKTMLGLRRMEPWAIRILGVLERSRKGISIRNDFLLRAVEGNKRRIENVGHPRWRRPLLRGDPGANGHSTPRGARPDTGGYGGAHVFIEGRSFGRRVGKTDRSAP